MENEKHVLSQQTLSYKQTLLDSMLIFPLLYHHAMWIAYMSSEFKGLYIAIAIM